MGGVQDAMAEASTKIAKAYARLVDDALMRLVNHFGWTREDAMSRLELRRDGSMRYEIHDRVADMTYCAIIAEANENGVTVRQEWLLPERAKVVN